MPARDIYHPAVRNALVRDGWTITHDPFTLPFGLHNLYVDLGAERLVAAERAAERIAVEIKSFVGTSEVADLEQALGQYLIYRSLLQRKEPERAMILAVPMETFASIFSTNLGRAVREDYAPALLIFDPELEVIRQWLK
jgi:hypothetical protein